MANAQGIEPQFGVFDVGVRSDAHELISFDLDVVTVTT